MPAQPFILGVNYWPRRKAMYWWRNFEAGEVREEFGVIKSLGMSLVRIFLLWEDWQPTPDSVDPQALDKLGTVCAIAAELGLQLDVTFFTGHMSGPSWAPGWMLLRDQPMLPGVRQVVSQGEIVNCGHLNPYTDEVALAAEELLLRAVVGRYAGHPAIGMWNLGNEPDLFAKPPSAAAGRAWARRMAGVIRALDPRTPITCGLHVPDLTEDLGLRANDIFAEVDIPAIHGYPMYADWSTGPLDSDFVPFLCALTSALCGKPTLMEEFGGCTEAPGMPSTVWSWTAYGQPREQFMASEEALAGYLAEVLPKLVEVGATGAMLWCYADYAPELWSLPPCDEAHHERFFGLVRPDGTLKPHAEVVRQFAATQPAAPSRSASRPRSSTSRRPSTPRGSTACFWSRNCKTRPRRQAGKPNAGSRRAAWHTRSALGPGVSKRTPRLAGPGARPKRQPHARPGRRCSICLARIRAISRHRSLTAVGPQSRRRGAVLCSWQRNANTSTGALQ